jgi:uncharacterized repeat protein (TIGR02543 family)
MKGLIKGMKGKLILLGFSTLVLASSYLLVETEIVDCGRLTVTTEQATEGTPPEYREYEYGSRDYEDYTFTAYWPSGQKRIIPFHESMLKETEAQKFDEIGKHEIEFLYQKSKVTLKIEVILPKDTLHHVLIFNSQGGTPIDSIHDINHGATIILPTPERDGHVFLGWYDTQDYLGDLIDRNTPITNSMILYAKWEELLS